MLDLVSERIHLPLIPLKTNVLAYSQVRTIRARVAVGTIIADCRPHRTVRALLCIRLPPWMTGVKALHRVRMESATDFVMRGRSHLNHFCVTDSQGWR
jgi:hypothetical protein